MMTTVRELIQALVLNCNLDDKVEVEFQTPIDDTNEAFRFDHERIRHVFHIADGEAIIECHDE